MLKYLKIDKINRFYNERKRGIYLLFYNIFGNASTLLLNFILPFYISVEDYGYFAILFSIFNVAASISTFGLDSSIIKFTLEDEFKESMLQTSAITWLIYVTVAVLFLFLLSFLLPSLPDTLISKKDILITILAGIIISFQRTILAFFLAQSNIKTYGFLFVINKVMQVMFFLVFFVFWDQDQFKQAIPIILLIQSLITLIWIILKNKKSFFGCKINKANVRKLGLFNLPLTFNTIGNIGYGYGFNIIMSAFIPLAQLGVLNIFSQFANVFSLSSNALSSGYLPKFYKEATQNILKACRQFYKYLFVNGVVLLAGTFFLGFCYFSFKQFTISRFAILEMLFLYLLGIFAYTFKSVGSNVLLIKGKTLEIAIFTILSVVISLLVGWACAREMGFPGSVLGAFAGYFFQAAIFNVSFFNELRKKRLGTDQSD